MVAKIEIYTSPKRAEKRKQHRWRSRAINGNKLAVSSEGYNNEADMIAAMRSTRDALSQFLDALP
jgi:uncharacterized protein YegP (UPF0339 family)